MKIALIILIITQLVSILIIIDHKIAIKMLQEMVHDYMNRYWLQSMKDAGAEIVSIDKEDML
jgi:hypothetical protein